MLPANTLGWRGRRYSGPVFAEQKIERLGVGGFHCTLTPPVRRYTLLFLVLTLAATTLYCNGANFAVMMARKVQFYSDRVFKKLDALYIHLGKLWDFEPFKARMQTQALLLNNS